MKAALTLKFLFAVLLALIYSGKVSGVPKFDVKKYFKCSVKKPLGLNLEEVAENKPQGVMIASVSNGGNVNLAGIANQVAGKFLCTVNTIDVRYKTFDEILDIIGGAPADTPLNLEMIAPDDVFKGPAILTVTTAEGKVVTVSTVKGLMMRDVLLGSGIDVYTNTEKLTNCGGGLQCGTCVVDVMGDIDWEARSDIEAKRLKKYAASCRLSCNTVVEGDATVVIKPQKIA